MYAQTTPQTRWDTRSLRCKVKFCIFGSGMFSDNHYSVMHAMSTPLFTNMQTSLSILVKTERALQIRRFGRVVFGTVVVEDEEPDNGNVTSVNCVKQMMLD